MPMDDAIPLTLRGEVRQAMRVQRSQVLQRTDRKGTYWFFRYWHDEPLLDGSIKATRKFHTLGPSKGQEALIQIEAEARGDLILTRLNTSPPPPATSVPARVSPEAGDILFGQLAEMWRQDYVENPKIRLAEPTRIKYRSRVSYHILPCRAGGTFPSARCAPRKSRIGCMPNATPGTCAGFAQRHKRHLYQGTRMGESCRIRLPTR